MPLDGFELGAFRQQEGQAAGAAADIQHPLARRDAGEGQERDGQPAAPDLHSLVEIDSNGQLSASLLPLADRGIEHPQTPVAVRLERAHPQRLGQGQRLVVVGFGLFGIAGSGVGIDGAKLVQRDCLLPTGLLLPGQVECLAGVLPGLRAASHQTTDLAEPSDPRGLRAQRACAETFADRLLEQRTPLREAPLQRRGIAKTCRD